MPDTKFEFQNLISTHIQIENAIEALRQKLNQNRNFSPLEAFNSLDINEDNSISADEIKKMIESRGFFEFDGYKECQMLVDKIDKNKDGRVTYQEFAEEFRNKSSLKRV